MEYIIIFVIIFVSLVFHEVSHGEMALALGDHTAEKYGRLSLNPLRHIDLFGTILLPMFLVVSALAIKAQPIIFGWAKPVPINPYNFKNPRRDVALVSIAGPAANLILAIFFSILIRLSGVMGLSLWMIDIFKTIVFLNVMWTVFNLVPIPPLDGSKIMFYFLRNEKVEMFLNRFGFAMLLIVVFYFFAPVRFVSMWLANLMMGI